jgi:hypothetical protein
LLIAAIADHLSEGDGQKQLPGSLRSDFALWQLWNSQQTDLPFVNIFSFSNPDPAYQSSFRITFSRLARS